ncbi:Crp/Fnr family transcriptional regulator [Streptomyces sp. NPDC006711]|uniref:Crp/Fnr family transcriptional regulator n=1 Tax=Streptomyces sp. NPDC006711 TaxID=3364762 RepID=UPI0036963E49
MARTEVRSTDGGGLDDQVPFLARLDPEARTALLALGRALRFPARTVVIHQDEPSTHVLLILHGWTKVTAAAVNGYEVLLALRGPGDIVGEGAALSGRPRAATVTSLERLETVAIEQRRFIGFLHHSPQVALQLLSLTTDRLRSGDQRRLETAALTVRERLAVLLLDLARTHGHRTPEGLELTVPLSQYEIAGSIGASREAVARLLKDLRDRRAVVTSRRRLVIVRPDLLRRISGGEPPL